MLGVALGVSVRDYHYSLGLGLWVTVTVRD